MTGTLAVTWWGHSSTTVELGPPEAVEAGDGGDVVRVATDPLFARFLFGLRRRVPGPADAATDADVVLVSHIHYDHLHVPSLRRFATGTPIVVPAGAPPRARGLDRLDVVEVRPGQTVSVRGVEIEVLAAHHDGRRSALHRGTAPALGFRFARPGGPAAWYPGDTGPRPELWPAAPVDLALVPIGGWGPSLGEEHLEPHEAAQAAAAVGARWAIAVHYGSYWPLGLRWVRPDKHRHYFRTPATRFRAAVDAIGEGPVALTPACGVRMVLDAVGSPPERRGTAR